MAAPGQPGAPPFLENSVISSIVRDYNSQLAPAYYGSIVTKLMQRHAENQHNRPQHEQEDTAVPADLGIQGDDELVMQQTVSNTPLSHAQRTLQRLQLPGLDLAGRDLDTLSPEERAEYAPHQLQASKGGFSDVYMSDDYCRYLATTHSDPAAVPELCEYSSLRDLPPAPNTVEFDMCASCSDNFTYSVSADQEPVVILKGVPEPGAHFLAVSYVWGETKSCEIPCKSCSHITHVPLRESSKTLHTLLAQVGGGNTVWLDCVSIDQSDPAEIADVLPHMGTIYKDAARVCVILPASDYSIFNCLGMAFCAGWALLSSKEHFACNRDVMVTSNRKEQLLSAWTSEFIGLIELLDESIGHAVYFQRAWTFQEWALARDIDLYHQIDDSSYGHVYDLKSVVIDAACLWARYIMLANQYANVRAGHLRNHAPQFVAKVHKLFPHEDFWLAADEMDADEAAFQVAAANISGVEHALGIRAKDNGGDAPAPTSQPTGSGATATSGQSVPARRVMTMLAAFNASPRTARYKADIVACWASMSNIRYPYNKNDSLEQALLKVVPALREQTGLQIFNFSVNNDAQPLSVDGDFMRMAAQQHQSTLRVGSSDVPLPGAPAFTGRADSVSHMLDSLVRPLELCLPSADEETTTIRRVRGAVVHAVIPIAAVSDPVLAAVVAGVTYGWDRTQPDDFFLVPPAQWAAAVLAKVGRELPHELMRRAVAVVRVPATIPVPHAADASAPGGVKTVNLWAWMICPSPLGEAAARTSLFVARESLNGTLMLFQEIQLGREMRIISPVGYLTLSDHRAGTVLVPVSGDGTIRLRLPGVSIPGVAYAEYQADRILRCSIELEAGHESISLPEALR